jgi:hypothetical protein
VSIALLLVFALVCYGWGRCVSKLCYGKQSETAASFEVALGIAALAAIGGLLNLFHLAGPASLYILSAVGVGLSTVFLRQRVQSLNTFTWSSLRGKLSPAGGAPGVLAYTPHCLIWLVAAFFCINLMPTAAFNHADDMQTYLVRPIRILATGSVGGNPFDTLGLDSLGAQSFFQAFLLLVSPLSWANGFDAVFCFALSGFLILSVARQLNIPWYFSLIAIIAFVSINPQFVNVSALYSTTAIVLASVIACSKLVEALQSNEGAAVWKPCLPLALLMAALLALKNTSLLLLVVQFPLFFLLLAIARPVRRPAIVAATITGAAVALALLPWIAVTLATYNFSTAWPGHEFAPTELMTKYPSLIARDMASLFKMTKLFYGGDQLTYTGIALCIAICGMIALAHRWFVTLGPLGVYGAPFASAAIGGFAAYCLNAHMNDAPTAVRYSCPILLALFPLAGLMLARWFALAPGSAPAATRPSWLRIVPALVPVSAIVLFLPLSYLRFHQTLNAKSIISYPLKQSYLVYNHYALNVAGSRTRALQDRTEPGQTLLAWIAQPFHLDYTRNQVFNASDPGLINPLVRFPAGVTETQLRQYLHAKGVRYVLHQFAGPGKLSARELETFLNGFPLHRKFAEYHLYLKDALLKMSETSRILYRDDQMVLFDLGATDEQIVTQR